MESLKFKTGDIILLNRKGAAANFFSKGQRFFTRMPYTHSAILLENIFEQQSILTSDELTNIQALSNYLKEPETDIEIYKVKVPQEMKEYEVKSMYNRYAGKKYGFAQILWFMYRWLLERFGIDARRKKNFFPGGVICSELVYHYLVEIAKNYPQLNKKLKEWNAETVHVGDIKHICESLPELFELKYKFNTADFHSYKSDY
jgi:hypothetical protein